MTSSIQAFRVNEVCALTKLGRTTIYEAIKRGDLIVRKRGRSTIILAADLERFLSALPSQQKRDADP
jgi:excisionase family DNA binding protein